MSVPKAVDVPYICQQTTIPFSQTLLGTLDKSFEIKHALLDGKLPFHQHLDNDEAFYLLSGDLVIELLLHSEAATKDTLKANKAKDVKCVRLAQGELVIVPKGMLHRPVGQMAHVIVMEKKGVPGGNGQLAKDSVSSDSDRG